MRSSSTVFMLAGTTGSLKRRPPNSTEGVAFAAAFHAAFARQQQDVVVVGQQSVTPGLQWGRAARCGSARPNGYERLIWNRPGRSRQHGAVDTKTGLQRLGPVLDSMPVGWAQ